jgi:ketosteroid isomerase-like protein
MSEVNVEVVRRVYDAAARRDADAVLALYDPDVEWDWTRVSGLFGQGGFYRGHEELRRWFREWSQGLNNIEYQAEELIAAGAHVISKSVMRGRGRASGIELGDTLYAVWTFREGKIVRVVWFPRHAEALEAAGLRE